MQNLLAEFRMGNLGMELYAVNFTILITKCGTGTIICCRNGLIGGRSLLNIICMTHPAYGSFGYSLKEDVLFYLDFNLAVFACISGGFYFSAVHEGDELTAVADAKNWNAGRKNVGIEVGRGGVIYAVGSSGKYNPLIATGLYFFCGDLIVCPYFGIYMMIPHTSCNQLIILTTEIKNQNFFHMLNLTPYSTVTDLARFFGLSISQPFSFAT